MSMSTLPQIDTSKETEKITHFISTTIKKASKSTALIAVSGGVDSTTALLLTAQALKPTNVIPLHLPTKITNPIHTKHAADAVSQAKIPHKNYHTIPIGSIIQKSWRIIKHYSPNQPSPEKNSADKREVISHLNQLNRLRLANLAARIRMMVIYDQAKKLNALVVGTENLSEHLLGYFTRYGDEASDLEPLKHLYKTQVYQLAKHLKVPSEIIDKDPSADLWKGQTDAQELGFSYTDADPILNLMHQGKVETEIIDQGFDKNLVKTVFAHTNSTRFKHQVPYALD